MEHSRTTAWALGLAAVLLLSAGVVKAQPTLPHENHYKVYRTNPITVIRPVQLVDQFGQIPALDFVLERFANPAEKRHPGTPDVFPIVDPFIHLMWWRLFAPPQPARSIVVIDQFGTSQWTTGDARYLLNPALKNVPPPQQPPVWNHYLCYEAHGPVINKPVILIDQFGTCNVVVLQAKLFCNPVEKREGAIVYPIIDYQAHLACYLVQNATPMTRQITAIDQFGFWQLQTFENDCLCVPALKEHTVKVQESTWGKIKALYN